MNVVIKVGCRHSVYRRSGSTIQARRNRPGRPGNCRTNVKGALKRKGVNVCDEYFSAWQG